MPVKKAYIMAGGKGTRLKPLVSDRPKCLAPINGRPFLSYQLSYLADQGIQEFVMCVGPLAGMIQQEFGTEFRGIAISYIVEESPLGTGGAFLNGLMLAPPAGPFVVVNGDTMFPIPLSRLEEQLSKREANLAIGLSPQSNPARYGSVPLTDKGFVTGIHSKPRGKGPQLVNSGVWVGLPSISLLSSLRLTPPMSLELLVSRGIMAGLADVIGVAFENTFIDIGTPSDYRRASDLEIFAPPKVPDQSVQ